MIDVTTAVEDQPIGWHRQRHRRDVARFDEPRRRAVHAAAARPRTVAAVHPVKEQDEWQVRCSLCAGRQPQCHVRPPTQAWALERDLAQALVLEARIGNFDGAETHLSLIRRSMFGVRRSAFVLIGMKTNAELRTPNSERRSEANN